LIDYYVEKVKIFKKVVEKIHPVLFEKAICIPIELNIKELKCFERFQADKALWWYQPSAFSLSFFTNLHPISGNE